MKKLKPLSLEGIKTSSLPARASKVSHRDFGRPWEPGGTFKEFAARLPRILAGERIGKSELALLGHGGLCRDCPECRYPRCSFGKGA